MTKENIFCRSSVGRRVNPTGAVDLSLCATIGLLATDFRRIIFVKRSASAVPQPSKVFLCRNREFAKTSKDWQSLWRNKLYFAGMWCKGKEVASVLYGKEHAQVDIEKCKWWRMRLGSRCTFAGLFDQSGGSLALAAAGAVPLAN